LFSFEFLEFVFCKHGSKKRKEKKRKDTVKKKKRKNTVKVYVFVCILFMNVFFFCMIKL